MRIVGGIGPRVAPYRDRVAIWWAGRSRREQALLGVLAALLLAALLLIGVIRPLQEARGAALAAIRTYDTLGARLRSAGPVAAATTAPRGGDTATTAPRGGDTAAIVGASLPQYGMAASAIASDGAGTRVRLAGVAYDSLVRWLADLAQTSEVRVDRMRVARAAVPGTVDADLVLRQ